MADKKYIDFSSAFTLAKDAVLLIWSRVRGKNERISLDTFTTQLPFERSAFSPTLSKNVTWTKLVEAVDELAFEYQAPAISGFTIDFTDSTLEVGETIAASSYTVNYSVANFENVSGNLTLKRLDTDATIDSTVDPSLSSQSVSFPAINKTADTDLDFELSGTDTDGNTFSSTYRVTWKFIRLYFTYENGDTNGDLLVGNRPVGDSRAIAITPGNLGAYLTANLTIDNTNSDLLQSADLPLQKWPQPTLLGDENDYRMYFVYQEDVKSATLQSLLGEVSQVSAVFSWTRQGVAANYVIYAVDQDYAGASSPSIGIE